MVIILSCISIAIIGFLLKCIYQNLDNPPEEEKEKAKENKEEEKPPPTLEETLISILNHFKNHISKITVYSDSVVIYCFKKSINDDISDFNTIKIRFIEIGFKSIPNDDCKELQEKLIQAIIPPPKDEPKKDK
ncbi:MAG: hypothetical protein ACI4WH_02955 [Oscillospiraceae bacterium]